MSAADAQAEPTMEEILASIRKIISEDDAPAADDDVLDLAEAEPVFDTPAPVSDTVSPDFDFDALGVDDEPEPAFETAADNFDIDDLVIEERVAAPAYEPAPAPAYAPQTYAPPPQPVYQETGIERLVGDEAAAQASSAFTRLNTGLPGAFMSSNTVEGLVAEMLRPMLREWLDNNLPRIVEEKVEAEVARLARRGF
jgi:uncharacterized protein